MHVGGLMEFKDNGTVHLSEENKIQPQFLSFEFFPTGCHLSHVEKHTERDVVLQQVYNVKYTSAKLKVHVDSSPNENRPFDLGPEVICQSNLAHLCPPEVHGKIPTVQWE